MNFSGHRLDRLIACTPCARVALFVWLGMVSALADTRQTHQEGSDNPWRRHASETPGSSSRSSGLKAALRNAAFRPLHGRAGALGGVLPWAADVAFLGKLDASAPTEAPLLLKEAVSREYSIHVGGAQTPEVKEAVSREVSFFNGLEPATGPREAVSREFSVVVTTPAPPVRITELRIEPSPTGETVTLSWTNYDAWAQRDVVRFEIYRATSPFTSVAGLAPFLTVGGETRATTLTGLPPFTDQHFAVVPVDAAGNRDPLVQYAAAYNGSREAVSREISFFIGADTTPPREAVSRELSLVVATPAVPKRITGLVVEASPTGDQVTLSWLTYDIWAERDVVRFDVYVDSVPFLSVTGRTPAYRVPGESLSLLLTNLAPGVDRVFAVVPVDATGAFDPVVNYAASHLGSREAVSRELSMFIGAETDSPRDAVSREYTLVIATPGVPAAVTGLDSGFTIAPNPTLAGAFDLDWSRYDAWAQSDLVGYRIYVATNFFQDVRGLVPFEAVPGETWRWTVRGLAPSGIYYFAVVAVDTLGQFQPAVRAVSAQAGALVDDFADRRVFTDLTFTSTTNNLAATGERAAGEPKHAGKRGGKSLWLAWRAPASGVATFRTTGSSFDTLLAVYTGSTLRALQPVAADDDRGGALTSEIRFNAIAGTEYQLAVDGYEQNAGDIVLRWALDPAAPRLPEFARHPEGAVVPLGGSIEFVADALPVGVAYQWFRNNEPIAGATGPRLALANLRPEHAGTYRVRARTPEGGEALGADAILEVVERREAGGGSSADKREDLFADAEVGAGGPFALHGGALAAASVSAGLPGTQYVDNTLSTRSANDPAVLGLPSSASRWFRLRFDHLPGRGVVQLSTAGSEIPTLLAVFTNRLDLRLIAQDAAAGPARPHATVWLQAQRGIDYLVMVDGRDGAQGRIRFNLDNEETEAPPANLWKDGRFFLQHVVPSGNYAIDVGTGLDEWRRLGQVHVEQGLLQFHDPSPPSDRARFFRLSRWR